MITHAFFDIGGVLGSNAWDSNERARAVAHFQLGEEFEPRHQEVVAEWEMGRLSLDEYLDSTVFFTERSFGREQFVDFMFEASQPDPATIALVRRVATRGLVRLFTLNNESEALNQHRITAFGLNQLFDGFLSSCWLGVRKPSRLIFRRALHIVQAEADSVLFVDDRAQNLQPAEALGMHTHHFVGADALGAVLEQYGLL
ncbi:MAG TPA: HAD-IA family hydrolase [Gemmatimonadaceae bacterium]|jgi:haloacid dehalogenase superfamily, subfamily IA, variant 3 with third motif having DD or ED